MSSDKQGKRSEVPDKDEFNFAVSFLSGFGLPVTTKSPDPDLKFERTTVKINTGTITNYFVPGNEDDQIRIYYLLAMNARKHKSGKWISKFRNYSELAKAAFNLKEVNDSSKRRAKKALHDLLHRSVTFDGTFLDKDDDGVLEFVRGEISFNLIHKIKSIPDKKKLVIYLDDYLMEFHLNGVREKLNHEMLNAFGKDQFTRKLYLWLTAQFWGRSKLHERSIETFMEEFGLNTVESKFQKTKYLNHKLKESMNKIWKVMILNKEPFVYWYNLKDSKIEFVKKKYRRK